MKVKILGIVGSPRHHSNTEVMIREALKGALETGNVETEILLLAGKKIRQCISCFECAERNDFCVFQFKDDMHEVYEKYLVADGLIIGSPVYHLSISGILKSAIDRLGQGIISKYREGGLPWFCKAGGVLSQGIYRSGGQEYAMQFLVGHLLLMNNVVVSPNKFRSVGVPGSFQDNLVRTAGAIGEYDPTALNESKILGKRVAEVAKIIKAGVETLKKDLPEEYDKYVLHREDLKPIKE